MEEETFDAIIEGLPPLFSMLLQGNLASAWERTAQMSDMGEERFNAMLLETR